MRKIIFVTLLSVACFGCGDVVVIYTLYIDNKTSDTINIVFSDKSPYKIINPDSLYFSPMNKKLLYGGEGWPLKDGCSYTGIKKDEVEISTTSGRKLKKDIWDVGNWNCSGSFNKGWEKIFVITEGDLE